MSTLLLDGLKKLNIEYEFQSASEAYKKGTLNKQIIKILNQSQMKGPVSRTAQKRNIKI